MADRPPADPPPGSRPPLDAYVHVALTVTDVDASTEWYARVLGFAVVGDASHQGGFGRILRTDDPPVWLALHHHEGNDGAAFTETRTGLDHAAFWVGDLDRLEAWRAWLDAHGVAHGPIERFEDLDVAAMSFRDPDDIQLELVSALR